MPQAHLTSKDPTLQTGNGRSGKRPEVTQAAVSTNTYIVVSHLYKEKTIAWGWSDAQGLQHVQLFQGRSVWFPASPLGHSQLSITLLRGFVELKCIYTHIHTHT